MDENEDPLDLLDDDGDGVIEMCLLEEEAEKQRGRPGQAGCCILLLAGPMILLFALRGMMT